MLPGFDADDILSALRYHQRGYRGWTSYVGASDGSFRSYAPGVDWLNVVADAFRPKPIELDEP